MVEHLHRPRRFDLAFAATRTDGLIHYVELGPGSTMARAVHWLTPGEVRVDGCPGHHAVPGYGEAERC